MVYLSKRNDEFDIMGEKVFREHVYSLYNLTMDVSIELIEAAAAGNESSSFDRDTTLLSTSVFTCKCKFEAIETFTWMR
jgi:hypothetical protein